MTEDKAIVCGTVRYHKDGYEDGVREITIMNSPKREAEIAEISEQHPNMFTFMRPSGKLLSIPYSRIYEIEWDD